MFWNWPKVTFVGDNGRSYDWIVKYGEDLRQDQRIQQVTYGYFYRKLKKSLL